MELDPPASVGAEPKASPFTLQDFESIYQQHADFVYNLAFRLCGNAMEADDLLQETFIRVYRYLSGYAGGSLKGWLRRIVVNLFLTRCKSKKLHLSLDADEDEGRTRRVDEALLDSSGDPAECLDQVSLDDRLQASLDAIPEEFRVALILRELDDLTYDQIASVLGVPIGTVRSRLSRARSLLRDQLGMQGA
jgi:RNA polymerase sigma-70 factor (ECF subfamily)